MNTIPLSPFVDRERGVRFSGGTLFQAGKHCLLFGNGYSLLLDRELADILKSGNLPETLMGPLRARGFLGGLPHPADSLCRAVRPEFFMIDLTDRCNMKCRYCLRNVEGTGESIRPEVLREICRYIQDYCDREGLRDVSIQPWGGEPLLELESILNMKEWISPARTRVHFSVETNAVLLTPEVIRRLYEARIGLGISIDGTRACHDGQRVFPSGAPTHALVAAHLKEAMALYGDRLGTITTVTRLNFRHIEEILEYFAVELGLTHVKFNFVHPSGFSDCGGLCLTEEEIAGTSLRMLRKLAELTDRGYPIVEKNLVTRMKNLLFRSYTDLCHSRGCCGGRKMIVFDRAGNLFPCELTDYPRERIGSIFGADRDLTGIVHRSLCTRSYFAPKRAPRCSDCPWHPFCGGGCTVRILSAGKEPPEIDTIECAVNRTLYPALAELILTRPETVNAMLGWEAVAL